MIKATKDNQLYIGDGVYAFSDGFHLVLQTGSGAAEIFLDSHVRYTLFKLLREEFRQKELGSE